MNVWLIWAIISASASAGAAVAVQVLIMCGVLS